MANYPNSKSPVRGRPDSARKRPPDELLRLHGLAVHRESEKAILLGTPDEPEDAWPPMRAWFPKSQVKEIKRIEKDGKTEMLMVCGRECELVEVVLSKWIVTTKYKDGASENEDTAKGGLADGCFDSYVTGEGTD